MDETEVEPAMDVAVPSTPSKQENVSFIDTNSMSILDYPIPSDPTMDCDSGNTPDLGEFLSRPVLVNTTTWNVGAAITWNINPWNAFFTDARIQNKINNYAFLKCNLKVKIILNASPFYYGRILVAYNPLSGFKDDTIKTDTVQGNLIPYSQRPHVWLNIDDCTGAEMHLPYIYHKNWIEATSASTLTSLGTLNFIGYTPLASANGATGSGVTIQTYVWAENVELAGPTVSYAAQSDEYEVQSDEYGQGPVSKIASAVAGIASRLTDIPIIGRFATATHIGAGAIGRIASLFGFTNVPVISDVMPFKSLPFGGLASTEISQPVEKLTLDPKNELTIDPRTVGLPPVDEMSIPYITSKESYLTQSSWATSQATDTILFSSAITPCLVSIDSSNANYNIVQNTPAAYISNMFNNWKGDVIFKFSFVKSPFHKGRVKFTWDPVGNIISNSTTTSVAYTKIVDISDESEVEIRIPYLQATAFLTCDNSPIKWWSTSTAPTFLHDGIHTNGTLTARVLTNLSAPVATSSIPMLVSVRMADNFEFANPDELPPHNTSVQSFFAPQSNEYEVDQDEELGHQSPDRYLVNYGEQILSLRSVLRRSTRAYTFPIYSTGTSDLYTFFHRHNKIPITPGFDTNGPHSVKGIITPATNYPYSFTNMTPLSWVMQMYIGYRGSTINHFLVAGERALSKATIYRSVQTFNSSDFYGESSTAIGTRSAGARWFANGNFTQYTIGGCGAALTSQYTQSGLSTLYPMYSNYRFNYSQAKFAALGDTNTNGTTDNETAVFEFRNQSGNTDSKYSTIERWVSAGTDFTCFFWLNAPSYYTYTIPTAN